MKKEITLRRSFADYVKTAVMNRVAPFAKFLSSLVEEEISPFQALLVIQAVCSFTALVFSVYVPLLLRLFLLGWFALSVWQCRRSGLK